MKAIEHCAEGQNEKAARATRAAFSSRENSSNGNFTIKTFWENLMSQNGGCQAIFPE
jgi:hypothetical protein